MRILRIKISSDPLKKIQCIKMTPSFSTSNGSEFMNNVCLLSVTSYTAEILQIHCMTIGTPRIFTLDLHYQS